MSVFDESMSRRSFAKSTVSMSVGAALGVPTATLVLAQDATPAGEGAPGLPPPPEGSTVVAEGLWNPRFLAFGDDGTLYITENGIGGEELLNQPEVGTSELEGSPEATPADEQAMPPSTRGYTGQISQVTADGVQSVVVEGLVSFSDGAGPNGIALGPGEIYFAIGGVSVGMGGEPLPGENTVNRYVLGADAPEVIAELGVYEVENNPDGTDVNPNLYGMANAADGRLLVADAGGNTLYAVDPATGEFELVAVVPLLGEIPGVEVPAEMAERQPVPTGVTVGADGTTYVGLLSEGWPEGAPSILALQADGTFAGASGPLIFNVAVTVGPDGLLYASQLFSFSEASPEPGPGSVVRINADGSVEPVVENVLMPHGLAFDVDGNLYVAINSLISGPGMAGGQVIRVDGVAAIS